MRCQKKWVSFKRSMTFVSQSINDTHLPSRKRDMDLGNNCQCKSSVYTMKRLLSIRIDKWQCRYEMCCSEPLSMIHGLWTIRNIIEFGHRYS